MKLAGLLLLPAGWCIVLTAVALLPATAARPAFALAGVAVEALGMVLAARAHLPEVETRPRRDERRHVGEQAEEQD